MAAAAALVLAIAPTDLFDRPPAPAAEPVAVVEHVEGMPRRVSGALDDPLTAPLSRNEAVRTGEWIETNARARAALRFSDGTSVRLDVNSRARALSSSVLELFGGAVYVDTGGESGRFEIRTAVATARDVGTQFEVRLLDRSVRLRVRTGIVELRDRVQSLSARAGTEITLSPRGAVSRPFAAYGAEWDWVARVAPPLAFEGTTLTVFLERIAREHGWTIHYADPALAREASGIILHGTVDGLAPREVVEVAIATSGLRHRLESGELVVFRGAGER
jgi:ferric-dicitrate binding protein FerR (iron transport regulator)